MHKLLLPATWLLGRLRYAQKFGLLAVVLVLPTAWLLQSYTAAAAAQISSSAKDGSACPTSIRLCNCSAPS